MFPTSAQNGPTCLVCLKSFSSKNQLAKHLKQDRCHRQPVDKVQNGLTNLIKDRSPQSSAARVMSSRFAVWLMLHQNTMLTALWSYTMTSRPASFAGGIMNLNGSCSSTCTAASMSANKRLFTEDSRKLTKVRGFHTKDDDHKPARGRKQSIKTGFTLLAYVLQKRCQILILALCTPNSKIT